MLRILLIFMTLSGAVALANAVNLRSVGQDIDQYAGDLKAAQHLIEQEKFADAHVILEDLVAMDYAPAKVQLGLLYEAGQGVAADPSIAVIWFYQAAQQGLPSAQLALAHMLMRGDGVPQDIERAYFWLVIARERTTGDLQARSEELIRQLATMMSVDTIAEVDLKAKQWKPNTASSVY